jgi:hypothetical protein
MTTALEPTPFAQDKYVAGPGLALVRGKTKVRSCFQQQVKRQKQPHWQTPRDLSSLY